jgi:serine protease AprX
MIPDFPDTSSSSTAASQQSRLGCGLLAAGSGLLCWFGLVSLLTVSLAGLLFGSLPSVWREWLSLPLLAGLWLVPLVAALWLVRRPGWTGLQWLSLSLLLVTGYALGAIAIRAVAGENTALETGLRLGGLTLVGLAGGAAALRQAGVPRGRLISLMGLGVPSAAGLVLGGGLIGLLTLGWPLTGALGDSWASLALLVHGLALALPEEIVFRGAILGLLTHKHQQRKALATALSLLTYLAFIPTQILPAGKWEALTLVLVLVPLALLTTQLRALTGSIWVGTLVAWFYRVTPQLFSDPRDEIPEPAQWLAWAGMLLGAATLALVVWGARKALKPRWRLSKMGTLSLSALLAVSVWGGWLGAWVFAGEPGFHNDGFIIVMEKQADLSAAYDISDPIARRAYVYQTLVQTAESTQSPVRARLDALGLAYRPYYLMNMIRVDGHHRLQGEFANLPGVAYVRRNPNVRPYPSHTALGVLPAPTSNGVEWNIQQVEADKVWEMGYRGQGVVVAGQDTGYDWEHIALKGSYRGWNAVTQQADHDYNWHDAWDNSPAPHDDGDHGTHTMGIIVGDDGHGNQIGMAPGAEWIGCRNMRRGIGNPASYVECTEFFLAPYPLEGDPFHDGDVTHSPDVVNNSWACPDVEGCEYDSLKPAVEALHAASIMMVVSAGNEGPACETVTEPPAPYNTSFSVGATDRSRMITSFSSRGPVPAQGGGESLLKPDIVAPGMNVRSSVPGNNYGIASGTSMAGPHVTGLVALVWSARPDLRGNIDVTEEIIRRSAAPDEVPTLCTASAQAPGSAGLFTQLFSYLNSEICACGGVTGVPNNVYGWGRINALRAVKMALAG